MSKLYFNKKNMGEYTNSEKLAQLKVEKGEWKEYGETENEIVMQGDGSGYCFACDYIEPLDKVKQDKLAELKGERDKLEVEPIATPYGTFDYDEKARERINAAIIALDVQGADATITWTLADNTDAVVTANILRAVIALVAKRSNELHIRYRQLANAVADCATVDAVRVVEW